jgi:hypothetical protein
MEEERADSLKKPNNLGDNRDAPQG